MPQPTDGAAGRPAQRAPDDRDAERVRDLGPWFHNLHLPDGTRTAPDHPLGDFPAFKWRLLAAHLPRDLRVWRALDVGCNAGFYSFELARRGADVRGLEPDPRYLAQARWAAERFDLPGTVRFEPRAVYDLAREDGHYDLIVFMGVFYHLRYPLLGLDIVARLARRLLVFQSLEMPGADAPPRAELGLHEREPLLHDGWPKMAFLEGRFAGDPTNWWAPNRSAVLAMLRSSGLRVAAEAGDEIYVCAPAGGADAPDRRSHAAELRSATGRPALSRLDR